MHQISTQRVAEASNERGVSSPELPCHQIESTISITPKEVGQTEDGVNATPSDAQTAPEEVEKLSRVVDETLKEFRVSEAPPPSYEELELACSRSELHKLHRSYRPRPLEINTRLQARHHLRVARVALFDTIPCTHPLMSRIRWDGYLEDSPSDYGNLWDLAEEDRSSNDGSEGDSTLEEASSDDGDWNDNPSDDESVDKQSQEHASSEDVPNETETWDDFSPEYCPREPAVRPDTPEPPEEDIGDAASHSRTSEDGERAGSGTGFLGS